MRGGINTDLAIVILLEIVLLTVTLLAAGHGFAFYVQRGLDDLVGGKDYQVVVQVEKKNTLGFLHALQETYSGREAFHYRIGKTLGDKTHILIGFGEQDLKNGALDEVAKLVSPLPGYAGLALLLDTAIIVQGIPQEVYPKIIKQINNWPEIRFAAKGPTGLYVVARNRKNLEVIQNKLRTLTAPYYVWELELTDQTNQEPDKAREGIEKALEGKQYWYLAASTEGVMGDAVRLLKSYNSRLVFDKKLPVGADLVISNQVLKIGSKPKSEFRARVFSDGIYLVSGDSLKLTGDEKAYLLDGSGRLKEALPTYRLESPRRDLESWKPVSEAIDLKTSAEELATKILQGQDFSLLLRDLEQLARKQNLELPEALRSKLEILILWDRIGRLPENFRADLANKVYEWIKTLPADPLLTLKESLPSWSDEDIYKSWRDIEVITRQKSLKVVTTEKAPSIPGVVCNPAAEIKEDIKSQIGGVVGGIVPLAALAATVILLWVFIAIDHSLWGSYLHMKQNFLAPLYGWLLGITEISLIALIMPFSTTLLVKVIYIMAGGLGSAFLITIANRISPLNPKSIEAGEALGLSKKELYRQVIIPDGRPGLWQLINRRKLLSLRRFKHA